MKKQKLFTILIMSLVMFVSAYAQKKPNILVIWGDDIGQSNISAYTMGLVGYQTPNIDRVANEGMIFTDYYSEQSCTAGRSSFITGQSVLRTGLSKVGMPGAKEGINEKDATIAEMLSITPKDRNGTFAPNTTSSATDNPISCTATVVILPIVSVIFFHINFLLLCCCCFDISNFIHNQ